MVKKTLKFKLVPLSKKDANLLELLINKYNEIVKKLLLIAKYSRLYVNPDKNILHKLSYNYIKQQFNLHSNHLTSARDRVVEMIKASEYHKVFPDPNCIPVRLFRNKTYFIEGKVVRISVYPRNYAKCLLLGDDKWYDMLSLAKGAELVKRNGEYYLHVTLEKDIRFRAPKFVVGIDTNLSNLTLVCIRTSDKSTVAEHKIYIKKAHDKRLYLRNVRAYMQSRYNRGFSKERNVIKNEIEKIVNEVYKFVRNYECIVAIENIKYVRKKLVRIAKSRKQRYLYSSFFYRRLLQRIKEKLEWYGIKVIEVNPAKTSITCSICGSEGLRKGRLFKCNNCGIIIDADLNASRNIALRALPALKIEVFSR